ncbi:Metallothionein 3 [Rhynchospora pubera]|uniref:Metallothionein 3 n=1 Tax=Rhynchospora pubera TaxID=906938 RepID=A0AAV8DPV1_9POAL|nr:Metallothionein 3 [Rhynchospora pubera]KAJ4782115.1 Metallothionein 3 [Rhynchospora pubera]KAJ4808534.1 Metallothionein 3 [Rhynchospora pubera]
METKVKSSGRRNKHISTTGRRDKIPNLTALGSCANHTKRQTQFKQQTVHIHFLYFSITMSDKCGNCDCSDKSQCTKKGNSLVITTESYTEVAEVSMIAEHDPKCKCGSTCTCTDCGCGK